MGHVADMGESKDVYRVLVGQLEGKSPPGRPRRRWQDNINIDLLGSGMWGAWIESSWLWTRTGDGHL